MAWFSFFSTETITTLLRASPLLSKCIPPYVVLCFSAIIYQARSHWGTFRLSESYWLTRIVFLRSLGFLYFVAFAISFNQNKQLIGETGLLPVRLYLDQVKQLFHNKKWQTFRNCPTLLWLAGASSNFDRWLDGIALAGLLLATYVMLRGSGNALIMFALWVLYHSIVNVGQRWFSFGWESQLLEMGFLAIFLTPLFSLSSFPDGLPPSFVCIFGYRWLIFRIMLGAGFIKVRGDRSWLDLTSMKYHYQTQPVPNFFSYYLHQTPIGLHKFETAVNHLVELLCPWFILFPHRGIRLTGGIVQILFQVTLILSGNLSFLNWLTILPNIFCLDDAFLSIFFSRDSVARASHFQQQALSQRQFFLHSFRAFLSPPESLSRFIILQPFASLRIIKLLLRITLHCAIGLLLAYLSIPVMKNLMATRQIMNTSFDPFRLVNTYGAFGTVTKRRHEVIILGSTLDYPTEDRHWIEYEFKVKPGNIYRRPPWISPYHYRLDWIMWFAGFGSIEQHIWMVHLLARLLRNDRQITSLMAYNPFQNGEPPKWIRADLYEYQYAPLFSSESQRGQWWQRRFVEEYIRPLNLYSPALVTIMHRMHWDKLHPLYSFTETIPPTRLLLETSNEEEIFTTSLSVSSSSVSIEDSSRSNSSQSESHLEGEQYEISPIASPVRHTHSPSIERQEEMNDFSAFPSSSSATTQERASYPIISEGMVALDSSDGDAFEAEESNDKI